MESIYVIIAEDNLAYSAGIKALLEDDAGIRVAGMASTGKMVLELLSNTRADVVMMDIQMPEMDGIKATQIITATYPAVKVIALTMLTAPQQLLAIMKAGARGYLSKDTTREELTSSIYGVQAGEYIFCSTTSKRIAHLMAGSELRLWNELAEFDDIEINIIKLTAKNGNPMPLLKTFLFLQVPIIVI
jgi:DNA-binding NarL/FixJ family response regulator